MQGSVMQERRCSASDSAPATAGPGADCAAVVPTRAVTGVITEQRRAAVMRIVETEVLPRLLLSLSNPSQRPTEPEPAPEFERSSIIAAFADVLLYGDKCAAQTFLRVARQDGMSLADVYVEVISPAAHTLCDRWERQACSFQQVAGGLIRLLSVLREVGGRSH